MSGRSRHSRSSAPDSSLARPPVGRRGRSALARVFAGAALASAAAWTLSYARPGSFSARHVGVDLRGGVITIVCSRRDFAIRGRTMVLQATAGSRPGLLIDFPSRNGWLPSIENHPIGLSSSGAARWTRHAVMRIDVPLVWPIAFFGALACLAALLRRRSVSLGACATCGYDLNGNVSGVCPECGAPARPDVRTVEASV